MLHRLGLAVGRAAQPLVVGKWMCPQKQCLRPVDKEPQGFPVLGGMSCHLSTETPANLSRSSC